MISDCEANDESHRHQRKLSLIHICGAFVWAGFPRRKERRPEFAATAERLQQRRTACLQRVQAVQREIGELCRTVGLSDAEEATVDAFERAVELARERCAAGERLAEEIQRQEAFCAEAERHAQTERAALEQASADERAAMARWLAWFQTHGVDAPLPGEAAVFCARVDSARMRLASALALSLIHICKDEKVTVEGDGRYIETHRASSCKKIL